MFKRITALSLSRYELIAFVVGMAILTFELTAARVVTPYLGDTIYTWTSIIGVILAALALGYYKGGVWADKRQKVSDIVVLLCVAAVLITLTNLLKDPILAGLASQNMPLQLKAFITSACLFAAPTFLLGVVSPYLSRLSIDSVATSGQRLSRIDAASTVGSLAGTFLTGFVLFGLVGSRNLLTCIALALLATSLLIYNRRHLYWQLGLLVAVMATAFVAPQPVLTGFIKEIDTAYSRMIIREIPYGLREARVLQSDGTGLQSGVYTDGSNDQPFAYIRGFSYLSDLRSNAGRYLIIGGGAFTFPEYLARKEPRALVDTVEIDEKLPGIARDYFMFEQPGNLRIISEDGRHFLNTTTARYDMIFLDAFTATVPPFQLLTAQAAARMQQSLTPNGLVVANIISPIEGHGSEMIRSVYDTFASVFSHVEAYAASPTSLDTKQNILLVGSMQPIDVMPATTHPEFAIMQYSRLSLPAAGGIRMTDDYAPVERLAF